MTYPPTPPPNTRTASTPLPVNHHADHNSLADAITDIVNELGNDPKNGYATVTAAIAAILDDLLLPAGVGVPYFAATAPTGWVLYQGQMISKASAPKTWARFGDLHGTSTTDDFYLPDMRLRVPVGLGAGDATAAYAATIGQKGGVKDASLIEHSHAVDPPQTNISIPGGFGKWINRVLSGGGGTSVLLNQTNYGGDYTAVQPTVNIPSFTSGEAGVADNDGTDDNLQPYTVVNYIGRLV